MIPDNIHSSWEPFLEPSIREELSQIERNIGDDYTPQKDLILRFMRLDLEKMKVVILGQDPYKPAGVANGRAFQPTDLKDWSQPFRQISLKNIVRNIYATHNNIDNYSAIPSFSYISNQIMFGQFNMAQPPEWFDSIESQGVLLLNTSFTCKVGYSNSHKGIWMDFTPKLIKYISKANPNLKWFLWGKDAAIYEKYMASGIHYKSRHPMMCSEEYTDDFLRNPCFKETANEINWLGQ